MGQDFEVWHMENQVKDFKRIQTCIKQMVQDGIICGASLGLAGGATAVYDYIGQQGKVIPYEDRAVEPGMYYDLASLTKVIGTAIRILQMADQRILCLDTLVSEILPRFQYRDIEVGQLLLHNSGLPAEIRDKEFWTRECMTDYLYTTAPIAKPGERFIYSDVGFILLGKVIETLDRMTLEESFRTHIFQPLGMLHTSYSTTPETHGYIPTECTEERGCICGEVHDKKAYLMGQCGSAGLFSTLEDVIRFAECFLNQNHLLFSEEWFHKIWQKEVFGRTYGFSKEYGAGILYHTGFTGTSILLDRNKNRGFVLLTNRIHPDRDNQEFLEKRKCLNQMFLEM